MSYPHPTTETTNMNANTPTLLNLDTSELREGDVIHSHGMVCLIDGPILSRTDSQGTVYWTNALVTNAAELDADDYTEGWLLARTVVYQPYPNRHLPVEPSEHRWSIQGNTLARWSVERTSA